MLTLNYLQGRPEELDRLRRPDATGEPLKNSHKSLPVTLEGSDEHHDQVGVGEQLGGVANAVVHHFGPVNFLQRLTAHPNWREFECLVPKVKWKVKDHVPRMLGNKIKDKEGADIDRQT